MRKLPDNYLGDYLTKRRKNATRNWSKENINCDLRQRISFSSLAAEPNTTKRSNNITCIFYVLYSWTSANFLYYSENCDWKSCCLRPHGRYLDFGAYHLIRNVQQPSNILLLHHLNGFVPPTVAHFRVETRSRKPSSNYHKYFIHPPPVCVNDCRWLPKQRIQYNQHPIIQSFRIFNLSERYKTLTTPSELYSTFHFCNQI